jgi:D-alanyl-lipoteichoic acid acyltransferase DltB (MBOAT superfamily)
MIAGQILSPSELLRKLKFIKVSLGVPLLRAFHLIIVGLFLKVVLGDQIGPWVDEAYTVNPDFLSGLDVFTMAYSFGLQIYFDFAGYSLIAIGSAQLLGVKFPHNFCWPYLAVSPRDFWRRWHITLSSWIRDYLYLPLQGVTVIPSSLGGIDHLSGRSQNTQNFRMILALFITWFVMGLWHGANWQFAFWGIWHACLIIIFRTFKFTNVNYVGFSFSSLIGNIFTIPLIMLGWIFFRSPNVDYALSVYSTLCSTDLFRISLAFRENFYIIVFMFYVGMVFCFYFEKYWYKKMFKSFNHKILFLSFLDSFMIFLVWMFWGGERQFIYFQF